MPKVRLCIPQIGEGLQEARLVAVLKNPGDSIRRDEPIYQMETDKAVMDVESPYEGVLAEWSVEVDTILPIGGTVGVMEVAEGVTEVGCGGHGAPDTSSAEPAAATKQSESSSPSSARRTDIPPRTRAYAKEKGIDEDTLAKIPAAGSKLMPADIDQYLGGQSAAGYSERAMPQKQRLLSSRLTRGSQLVVPGTIMVQVSWRGIEAVRHRYRSQGGDFQPSSFTMFSFAVAKALAEFPAFRTTLLGDSTLRTYDHAHLGIAVALPGDELVLAVVEDADTLAWTDFAQAMRAKIELARNGEDQANEAVTLSLTNMQSFGLRDAVPVVVPPSVGTLFLGEVYKGLDQAADTPTLTTFVNLALTFDHRLINGVGGSEFINKIRSNVENIESLITG